MNRLAWLAHAVLALALTVLTQVGGVIYVVALLLRARLTAFAQRPRLFLSALFVGLYALAWFPIQAGASLWGRVGLPCTQQGSLRAASPVYCIAHRHYVSRDMLRFAQEMSLAVDERHPGALTQMLDANFPFFDGFAMLPHLSHDDGRKLDFAFYYAEGEDYRPGALRSPIGYWAFEQPGERERQPCRGDGGGFSLRWNQDWFQPFVRDDLVADEARLRTALTWSAREGRALGARRAFIEPHLADRLGLDRGFARFQGCGAARHDDHFHVELR